MAVVIFLLTGCLCVRDFFRNCCLRCLLTVSFLSMSSNCVSLRISPTHTHTEDIKYHETGNGWSFVTVSAWKNFVNAAVGGVGLLIEPRALKTLNSIEKIQPRMMAATFNGNPRATIISSYSPTNVSEETELVKLLR